MSSTCTAIIVAVFLFAATATAAIVRVPSEQPTIQAALDAISANDTILVSEGLYPEELIAPEFGFSMIGDVEPDTGLFHRPIIDPSALDSPTTRSCLKNLHGNVTIDRMWFKNSAAMYPHDWSAAGGINNETSNLIVRDCVFDSTCRGILSFDSSVTLERCVFLATQQNCVYAARAALRAYDCIFESLSTEWSGIIGGDGTIIERCQIRGTAGELDWMLVVGGGTWHVRDNLIGPCDGSRYPVVLTAGPEGVFEDNVITGCRNFGPMLSVRPQCEGTVQIRNNTIMDNELEELENGSTSLFRVLTQYDSFTLCSRVLVHGNSILNNLSFGSSKGLSTGGDNVISRNTFRDLLPENVWAVEARDGNQNFRENVFIGNELALYSLWNEIVDAEYNYWGHETGPYHPDSNQFGQGDEVGDNVDFIPWHTDTLFMTYAHEPRPPLPEKATLLAYPNPFNAVTTIQLTLPRAGIARIELFDITGRKVKELWSGAVGETRDVQFNAADFASGIYFVRAWDPLGNRLYAATKVVLLK